MNNDRLNCTIWIYVPKIIDDTRLNIMVLMIWTCIDLHLCALRLFFIKYYIFNITQVI